MKSKPWYSSHALWGAILLLVSGIVRMAVDVSTIGWTEVGWDSWAQTLAMLAAGVGVAVARIKHGADPGDGTTAPIAAPRFGAGAGALVALAIAAAALAGPGAGCGPGRLAPPETPVYVSAGVSLGCAAALLAAEAVGSTEARAWINRICGDADLARLSGTVAGWFSEPQRRPLSLTSGPGSYYAEESPPRVVILYDPAGGEPIALPCLAIMEACELAGDCAGVVEACAAD